MHTAREFYKLRQNLISNSFFTKCIGELRQAILMQTQTTNSTKTSNLSYYNDLKALLLLQLT